MIACEWKGDCARDLGWLASNDSKIAFGHTSLLEGVAEGHACFPAPREDEKPRRVAVKAMNRFQRTEGRRQPYGHGRRIEWCAGRHARHPGGFVDDHDPLVSKHDSRRQTDHFCAIRPVIAHRIPSIDAQRQSRSAGGGSASMALS